MRRSATGTFGISLLRAAALSGQNFVDHVSVHVGQAAIGAVEAESQPRVVDAHQVQNRGVEIVAPRRLPRFPGPFVALAVGDSRLDSRTGQPRHECAGVVIAAGRSLAEWHPAKLGCPDDQRILEEPAGLEILHERRAGLIGGEGHRRQLGLDVAVIVPIVRRAGGAAPDLHEAHPSFSSLLAIRQLRPKPSVGF